MAHDDIDQIAASSRLSTHDIKKSPAGPAIESSNYGSHPGANGRILNSGLPNSRNLKPIVLEDNAKSNGNSVPSNTHYQPYKPNHYDRNIVEVSVKFLADKYCLVNTIPLE